MLSRTRLMVEQHCRQPYPAGFPRLLGYVGVACPLAFPLKLLDDRLTQRRVALLRQGGLAPRYPRYGPVLQYRVGAQAEVLRDSKGEEM